MATAVDPPNAKTCRNPLREVYRRTGIATFSFQATGERGAWRTLAPKGIVNATRTKWSPNWSRTRDHRSASDNTKRTGAVDFAIQINTCRDKTKRDDTAVNKFTSRFEQRHLRLASSTRARRREGARREGLPPRPPPAEVARKIIFPTPLVPGRAFDYSVCFFAIQRR